MASHPFNPIAGIGLTPHYSGPAEVKFTSASVLDALIEKLRAEPELVRNQFNIVTKEESGEMTSRFWPAALDPTLWTRLSTHRPSVDEQGEKIFGTDREVREYENDFWADDRKILKAWVTTEHGSIIDYKVQARW